MTETAAPAQGPSQARLWAEMLVLFVGVPVLMLVFFGHYPLFGALLFLAAIAAGLLQVTPGFSFGELLRGPLLGEWRLILAFALLTAASTAALAIWLVPWRFLAMPTERTGLWLMIMIAYPIASVLPQELIYRPLFFRRYGALWGGPALRVIANGALFAVGHLFYQNPVAILCTLGAGILIGAAYERTGSFPLAVVLHALAGQIMFTMGLGVFFYHGAV
ncbi:MAG: CPBP family intramembrane glutamic endopeptidase [Paracoccaceae bacterium]